MILTITNSSVEGLNSSVLYTKRDIGTEREADRLTLALWQNVKG